MAKNEEFSCSALKICGGCPQGLLPYSEQLHLKVQRAQEAFPQVAIQPHKLGVQGLRDRGDFIIFNNQLSLFSRRDPLGKMELIPIDQCPQLNHQAQAAFNVVKSFSWPIQKGSIRLRVNPDPKNFSGPPLGLWLDFANLDIKSLLESQSLLQQLLEQGIYVEVGQKQKQVVHKQGKLKLEDGQAHPWSLTYIGEQKIPLYSFVSSFTQTGIIANRVFAHLIETSLQALKAQNIVEFGSGIGTLTFPALGKNRKVRLCEVEESALTCVKISSQAYSTIDFINRMEFKVGNFHKAVSVDFFTGIDTILVNPPRSGIGDFLSQLSQMPFSLRPTNLLYLSCFLESMKLDSQALEQLGYKLKEFHLVDQFPQSHHFESFAVYTL